MMLLYRSPYLEYRPAACMAGVLHQWLEIIVSSIRKTPVINSGDMIELAGELTTVGNRMQTAIAAETFVL